LVSGWISASQPTPNSRGRSEPTCKIISTVGTGYLRHSKSGDDSPKDALWAGSLWIPGHRMKDGLSTSGVRLPESRNPQSGSLLSRTPVPAVQALG
jgi:hypothetical protein